MKTISTMKAVFSSISMALLFCMTTFSPAAAQNGGCPSTNFNYCPVASDDKSWLFQEDPVGGGLSLTFNGGFLEETWDFIRIYDGVDATAPVLLDTDGALSGTTVVSTSGNLFVQVDTDGGVQCSSNSTTYAPLDFDVFCGVEVVPGCTDPTALNYDAAATTDDGSCVIPTCQDPSLNVTYCAVPNDATEFLYTGTTGSDNPAVLFNAGTMEAGFDDITIYDGTTNTDPVLFNGDGDLSGVAAISTSGNLLIVIDTDGSNQCSSGGQTELDFDIFCGVAVVEGCTDPTSIVYNPNATVDDGSCIVTNCQDSPENYTYCYDNNEATTFLYGPSSPGALPSLYINAGTFESGFDDITIYDGDNTSAPTLLATTGGDVSGTFVESTTGFLLIEINSDGSASCGSGSQTSLDYNVSCGAPIIEGCTDPTAVNYNVDATDDDGSCIVPNCPTPTNVTFCYDSNADDQFIYNAAVPGDQPILVINSGVTEAGFDDLIIYDGNTTAAPELYNATGDHAGLIVQSTSGSLLLRIVSDGSVSCVNGTSPTTLDYDVYDGAAETCLADAGTITADANPVCLSGGTATISATPDGNSTVPTGYVTAYVLTSGAGLDIVDLSLTAPSFDVTAGGDYTIHTLILDPADQAALTAVSTGFDVNDLLLQGCGSICGSLDVAGAPITVNAPEVGGTDADASSVCLDGGSADIGAESDGNEVVPAGYSVVYVLTDADNSLEILDANATGDFTVNAEGNYIIHTFVYDAVAVPDLTPFVGQSATVVVAAINDGSVCAALDVDGAPITVELCTPANDLCGDAIAVACGDVVSGSTADATDAGASDCDPDGLGVWYSLEGTGDNVTLDLSNSSFDTYISVTESCGGLCLADDDDGGAGTTSLVTFSSVVGQTYYIQISGFGSNTGDYEMEVTCVTPPANDLCGDAIAVACGDIVSGSTVNASSTGASACDSDGLGVWYSFEGTGDNVTLDLSNSNYDTYISVTESCGGPCLAFDDDGGAGGGTSLVTFSSVVGQTYYIQISGFGSATGDYEMEVTCATPPPPPANDLCADAIPVACGDVVTGDNTAATEQTIPSSPSSSGPGVWYSFQGNGQDVTFSTCTTTSGLTDTEITIATGDCNELEAVAQDDDGCGGIGVPSELTIYAHPDTLYYVYVSSWQSGNTDAGEFELTVTCACPTPLGAGTLGADSDVACLDENGEAILSATEGTAPDVPAGYDVTYVLTSGAGLIIEVVNSSPSFTVTEPGLYTLHTLVSTNTLDLGVVDPGVTPASAVLGIVSGDDNICAALDVDGAPVEVTGAGTITADATPVCLVGGSATISATPDGNQYVPAGYTTTYVLTMGTDLVIMQAGATAEFTVTADGDYTIHTLVHESSFDPLTVVTPGTTTGGDVNALLVQGGGSVCAALDVDGAGIVVDICTGIQENLDASLAVYPNPSNGEFVVEINGVEANAQLNVMDLTGRVVFTEAAVLNGNFRKEFNLNVVSGTYLLQILTEEGMVTRKLQVK